MEQNCGLFDGSGIGGDYKLRINLSAFALDTISDDMIAFGNGSMTNFVNTVIRNYCPDASASIYDALENERHKLENDLRKLDARTRDSVIRELLISKEKELKKNAASYESGKSCVFRLQKDVYCYLTQSPECKEALYYDKVGRYLKAVIEEYCTRSFKERELIYFREKVRLIETAVENNRKMMAVTSNGDSFFVYPYGIFSDSKSMYNYLVGYSVRNQDEEMRPMSMRISADNEFRLCARRDSRSLNFVEKKKLEKLIEKRGVQFMVGEEDEIHVILSETGIKQYNRQLHLRPTVSEIRNGNEYIFRCTLLQAEVYFMRLGKEARVIAPERLVEKMKENYRCGYNLYSGKETE